MTRNLWPFTIRVYAIVFIGLMALISGILGWAIEHKLDTISTQAKTLNTKSANEELAYAISRILNEIKQRADNIAFQDEARQQFINPSYYGYWRDNRALGKGVLPSYMKAIELYTRQGNSLSANPMEQMPTHIMLNGITSYLTRQSDHYYLNIFYPIPAINALPNSAFLGYLGFKLDFMHAITEGQRFSFVNLDSVHINIDEQEHLPLSQLTSRLEYTLLPDAESTELAAMIKQFQREVLIVTIVLSVLLYIVLTSVLAAPLHRLSLHIDALREGHKGLLKGNSTRSLPVAELEKVRHSLNDYQNKLEQLHQSLKEKNDELWQLAHHDPLTGIYNRRGFEDDWQHVLAVSAGRRLEVTMLLFDCDHFKTINDTYGHQTGDKVIRAISNALQSTLRYGDRLYRLGGDEFATLLLDVDPGRVLQTAERCIEAVSQCDFSSLGIKEPVRISAGLSSASGTDIEILSSLPKRADIAMYHAKRPGKQKIAVYDDSMTNYVGALFSTSITNAVFEAVTSGSLLEMHYQPVVNLVSGEVDYYEALMRIRADDDLILPSSIFPIIQERRLEVELDLAIIGRIEKDLEQGRIPAHTGVSLNVSGPSMNNSKIIRKIQELGRFLDRYILIIEITETALITQIHQASANLNELRNIGFKIALDDFGSGYSSLGYLANMPVDIIKFDISMIRHLDTIGKQGIIVENLANMVIKAGYMLVAEGLETEKSLQKIVTSGFSYGQGYLFGLPEISCREAAKFALINEITG